MKEKINYFAIKRKTRMSIAAGLTIVTIGSAAYCYEKDFSYKDEKMAYPVNSQEYKHLNEEEVRYGGYAFLAGVIGTIGGVMPLFGEVLRDPGLIMKKRKEEGLTTIIEQELKPREKRHKAEEIIDQINAIKAKGNLNTNDYERIIKLSEEINNLYQPNPDTNQNLILLENL
jgi:hypothetical protein